ncbi:hypothetical protein [Azospirillum sp. sgz302134]
MGPGSVKYGGCLATGQRDAWPYRRQVFVRAFACALAHLHIHWMMMEYGLRFDFDGWMVIDTTMVDGELAGEAVRRGLPFAEAEHLAECLNRSVIGHHANQN